MSVLELRGVSKRFRERKREHTILREVDLQLDAGELVVVYGPRRSGRTTLLRLASGVETPDDGVVLFQGRALGQRNSTVLGGGVGYVQKSLRSAEEPAVLEQVGAPLLARGISHTSALERARTALERSGAPGCASLRVDELSSGESMRVALARALVLAPAVLVVDEPASNVDIGERDGILALLRSLASQGLGVLASTGEPAELAGAHQALTLGDGALRGSGRQQLAPVVPLRRTS